MENIARRIQLFHKLFLVCVTGMMIFLIISLFLFVRLRMREVIGFFTRELAEKEILNLEKSDFEKTNYIRKISLDIEAEEKNSLTEGTIKLKKKENVENGFSK